MKKIFVPVVLYALGAFYLYAAYTDFSRYPNVPNSEKYYMYVVFFILAVLFIYFATSWIYKLRNIKKTPRAVHKPTQTELWWTSGIETFIWVLVAIGFILMFGIGPIAFIPAIVVSIMYGIALNIISRK